MATIEKAGVFVKDGKGNVGKLNGLTDNDVAKIQATMTTVDNITDDNGALPDATSTTKGVVLAADANTDVVQPSSGQQYALTTASTPQLVTVKDAQMITGEKSFTGGVLIDGSHLYVTSDAAFISNNVSFMGSNITATSGAVDLSGAQAVHVPTASDTTDSSSYAASTEFVQNAIDAKAPDLSKYVTTDTEQTITGSKNFSGTLTSSRELRASLLYAQSFGLSHATAPYSPYFDMHFVTYSSTSGDNSTTYGYLTANNANTLVDFSKANNVKVPTATFVSGAGSTQAASTAYVDTALSQSDAVVHTNTNSSISAGTSLYVGGTIDAYSLQGSIRVPTQDISDNSNASASTAFVHQVVKESAVDPSQVVTLDDSQTISGDKSFTGAVSSKSIEVGYPKTSALHFKIYGESADAGVFLAGSSARVLLGDASEVRVPTVSDTTDSSTKVASTAFVQNAVTSKLPFELNAGYAHRKIYRGYNLLSNGFSSIADIANAVYNADFSNIYIGDYFSVDLGNYGTIAYVADIIPSYDLSSGIRPCLILVTKTRTAFAMNSTATTSGGIESSTMFTSTLPAIDTALCGTESAPFYGMLASCSVFVSSAVNSSVVNPCFPASSDTRSQLTGASSAHAFVRSRYAFMLSDYHVFGARLLSTSIYDVDLSTLSHQLPLFALVDDGLRTIFPSNYYWLCNICSSTHYGSFAYGAYDTSYCAATATDMHALPYAYKFIGKASS